jgi:hypothetical protein
MLTGGLAIVMVRCQLFAKNLGLAQKGPTFGGCEPTVEHSDWLPVN